MTEPTNTTEPTAPTTEPTEEPRDPNDPFVQDDITLEKYSAAIRLGAAHGALLFVSPTGSSTGCTSRAPCGLREALRQAAFGDTVTLYNGIYGSEQERK